MTTIEMACYLRRVMFMGEKVKALRALRKMTQEQLAYRSGVSLRTVARTEAGGTASARVIALLARALDVEPGDLFEQEAS